MNAITPKDSANPEANSISHAGANTDDPPGRIECAAVRHDATGLVFSLPRPARHHDILHAMHALGLSTAHADNAQGFLVTDGRFAWRSWARVMATRAAQLLPRARDTRELFSEDVW